MGRRSRFAGFTLIEAMVALAIVALGMMAVNTQLNRYVVTTAYVEQKTLASWIAANVLTELSVSPQWPEIGEIEDELDEEFAQRRWTWTAVTSETPIENLRRVDVSVFLETDPDTAIHTISGFLEPPPPRGLPAVNWLSAGPGFRSAVRAGMGAGAGQEPDMEDGSEPGVTEPVVEPPQ